MPKLKSYLNFITDRGFIGTFILALTLLFFFFGNLLKNPNQTYFDASGDGLQAYYTASYHVKHDQKYWHFDGLNSPYGEQVFFSGCQPFVTNIIKFLKPLVDLSGYTIGILNCLLLFSIVFAALFLYLIFKELGVPKIYASLAAVGIAFLSPQIERLGGHYSLAYVCAIPMMLYFLLKFSQSFSMRFSVLIALTVLFFSGTHLYFVVFFAFLLASFYTYMWIGQKEKLLFCLKHFSIQFLIPIILFQVISILIDPVNDRSDNPWGFLIYTSNINSILFAPNRFYSVLYNWMNPTYSSWEGFAYIGFVGTLTVLSIGITTIFVLFKKKWDFLLKISDNWALNSFFIAAIFAMIFSFGLPFSVFGGDKLLNYFGPIKQFRGVGRFAWLFFYVTNIVAFYSLFYYSQKLKKSIQVILFTIALAFLFYDTNTYLRLYQNRLNNQLTEMSDTGFYSRKYPWFKNINFSDYQGLIPLPYFHVGSENIWMEPESNIKQKIYPFALVTGVPICGVNLSRTSLSQTYKNIQLILEPYKEYAIFKDLKSMQKPLLVFVIASELKQNEVDFLSRCHFIQKANDFELYEIYPREIQAHLSKLYQKHEAKIEKITKSYSFKGFLSSDSLKRIYWDDFDHSGQTSLLFNQKTYRGSIKNYNVLVEWELKPSIDSVFKLSFWVNNFTRDLIPRTTVEISYLDDKKELIRADYYQFKDRLKIIDGSTALIESEFTYPKNATSLKVTCWNDNFFNDSEQLEIDNLLIFPDSTIVFQEQHNLLFYNNRVYKR